MDEVPLDGGNVSTVVRVGDTVRRSAGPWTPTVHAFLRHVRERGVRHVPEPLGVDAQGREVLAWVPGTAAGWPVPGWVWEPGTLADLGRMLREVHDASTGFLAAHPDATWRSPAREPAEVVALVDVAPYNVVHDGTRVTSFIDVDMAAPGPRAWDLAYLAYRVCGWCEDMPAPDGPAPLARLDALLDAYGRDVGPHRGVVLATMVERLEDLARWTDAHATATGRDELRGHAAMYRRDAARVARLVR